MATFGEMLAAADRRLSQVAGDLRRPDARHQARHPGTVAELARLTGVLARYNEQIAGGFGVPYASGKGVRDAARRSAIMIRQAERILEHPGGENPQRPHLAWNLRATADTLGCGLDLLASHSTDAARPATADNRALIADITTAHWLLHVLSEHTATAGHVALRAGPQGQRAGRLPTKAAVLTYVYGRDAAAPVTAVPLRHSPERLPPAPGEQLDQTITGIGVSAQRLDLSAAGGSITTWRYLARASAITHDIGRRLVRQISRRIRELDDPALANALGVAANAIHHTGVRWRNAAQQLYDLTGGHGNPATPPATDAADIVLRMGRLLYDDPAWSPGPRAVQRVIPLERLAPDTAQASLTGIAVLNAVEACNIIAGHHHTAISEIVALGGLRQGPSGHLYRRHAPAEAQKLVKRYADIQDHTDTAINALAAAVSELLPEAPHAAEHATLVLRHLTPAVSSPSALAALDFPMPINEALRSSRNGRSDASRTSETTTKGRSIR